MELRNGTEVDYKQLKRFDEETNTRIFYRRYKLAKGTSDRDSLFKQQFKVKKNGGLFAMRISVEHEDFPQVPGVMRGEVVTYYFAQDSKDGISTNLTYINKYDMKGFFGKSSL